VGSYDQSTHWSLVNVLARIFGIVATIVGVIFLLLGGYSLVFPDSPSIEGMPAVLSLGVGIFGVVVGVAFLRVRSYRPDLAGSETKGSRSGDNSQRSWWTGMPQSHE
jgi:hypothetical protein